MSRYAPLDQFPHPVGQVMPSNLLGVDMEPVEDDLDDGSADCAAAALVEALRVSQQFEGGTKELATGFKLGGGVIELSLDLGPLTFDRRQLGLELGSGPVWIGEEVEETVLLGVQLVQAGTQALLEGAEAGLLEEEGVVKLSPDELLEVVGEADGGQVTLGGCFDLGDGQVRQVAEVLLAAPAEEVEVGAAVAFAAHDDEAMATAVAPEQSFEPVVVLTDSGAAPAADGQDSLDPVIDDGSPKKPTK